MAVIMESGVQLKLNVKTVLLKKDVGLNKELRFMVLINMEQLKVNKPL